MTCLEVLRLTATSPCIVNLGASNFIKASTGKGGQTLAKQLSNHLSGHSDLRRSSPSGGVCLPMFGRKFVEIRRKPVWSPLAMQYRCTQTALRNPSSLSADHKHDRTSFARVCLFVSPASYGCRSAAALINEETFGNRAPFFHRIVCGKPPSATVTPTHTHSCKSSLDLLISLRQAADVAIAIFGPEWCAR